MGLLVRAEQVAEMEAQEEAATEIDEILTLVEVQCPHESAPNFFGSLLTYDGVHMSAEAHQILADAIVARLNDRFDLGL